MVSETTSEGSEPQLNVTASRWRAPTQSVKLDKDGRAVRIRQRGSEVGPSDQARADAEQLLNVVPAWVGECEPDASPKRPETPPPSAGPPPRPRA